MKKKKPLLEQIGKDSKWPLLAAAIERAKAQPLPPHPPSAKGI